MAEAGDSSQAAGSESAQPPAVQATPDRSPVLNAKPPSIQVDYVVVFSLKPPPATLRAVKSGATSKASHAAALKAEYNALIAALQNAGLEATGRPGGKGREEVLVLVKATDSRVRDEIERERLIDWLHGITHNTPASKLKDGPTESSYTAAERLRHVYSIITQASPSPTSSSASCSRTLAGPGAGITPRSEPYPHVASIFPPHDPAFNRSWLSRWSDRSHVSIPESEFDQIKDHFGDSIAFYFVFLRAYFRWLAFPTAVGSVTWLLGWKYSPFYAGFLVLWSLTFVEYWRIQERQLAVKWSTFKCGSVERPRSEFKPTAVVTDPVTGEKTGHYPWWQRDLRTLAAVPVAMGFVAGLVALITGITVVEVLVQEIYKGPCRQAASLLPTMLFVGLVPQIVGLWQKVALRLVAWENHPHESGYARSLTLKMFALNAIVAYTGLFLTAFVYIPFGSLLVPHLASFAHRSFTQSSDVPNDEKPVNTAAFDWSAYAIDNGRLHAQLFAFTVTNQAVGAFTEIGLPYIMSVVGKKVADYQEKKNGGSGPSTPAEEDAEERALLDRLREEAALPEYTLFVDYAEMAVQFGYVALWTVVWPIAPLFAYINNFFELRTDALKITSQRRRPVPTRADTIGPWLDTLGTLSWISALINAALVYLFRPESHPSQSEGGRVVTVGAAKVTAESARSASSIPALRGALFSALLAALASEHGYLVARSVVRYLLERWLWKGSEAEIRQRRGEWELKRGVLSGMNLDVDGGTLRRGSFILRREVEADEGGGDGLPSSAGGSEADGRFWNREDRGLGEIERTTKTE